MVKIALATGMTLMMVGVIVGEFARWRGWPRAENVAFRAAVTGALVLAGIVLVVIWSLAIT